ncbi:alpha/beta hydrolase [Caulobacter segnis]|uniref:Alpha/beta hydrolase n=1 Tax=Caulobacter segnis TaxID=88688 RepID=A0A2W5VDW7_9CAUL|nr:alpha/beta hydrolase [Caulobacter segnis]PZR36073.1 MAG: alpha/beta hydrolase [Caulobacter segnis]
MMRSALAVAAGVLALTPAFVWAAEAKPPIPSFEISTSFVRPDPLPPSKLEMPGGVTVWKDLVYIQRPGFRPLTLDLYTPAGAGKRPLIVQIHGGGWSMGDSRQMAGFKDFPAVLANLASRGYVVAAVNYRLSGEAPSPAQADDVDAAIRWLKAHAAEYGIDPTRSATWGDSSGGHLSAMAALDCSGDDCVTAGVSWYGVFDLTPPPNIPYDDKLFATTNAFLGCKIITCPERVKAASPITHVKPNPPPMLLIHGDKDFAVPFTQSVALADALRKVGGDVELKIYEGANHGWWAATPEATRAFHQRALEDTFAFFDRVLKPSR